MDTKQFAGHTPGPWVRGENSWTKMYIGGLNKIKIAHVYEWNLGESKDNAGQYEPNARLIAAAPSLLAEVERLQAREKVLADALNQIADDNNYSFTGRWDADGHPREIARAALETK